MSVLNRWFDEVWNQGRESAIDEMVAPEAVVHGLYGPDGKEVVGVESFKAMYRAFHSALSDIHVAMEEIEEIVEQGAMSVARCVVTATHTGDGLGKSPRGNRVTFTGMTMARERDGKIVEGWNNFDFATMYQMMQ